MVSLGDCHTYIGYMEQQRCGFVAAEDHYDKAVAIFDECRNDKKKLKAIRYKGSLLLQKGRLQEAIDLLDAAVAVADKLDSDYEAAKCFYYRYRALKAAERDDDAFENLEKAKACMEKVDKCRWSDIIMAGDISFYVL